MARPDGFEPPTTWFEVKDLLCDAVRYNAINLSIQIVMRVQFG